MKVEDDMKQVLIKARALIEKGWCQGHSTTYNGNFIPQDDQLADAFCATAAVHRACKDNYNLYDSKDVINYIKMVNKLDQPLMVYNDCIAKNKQEIIALFDKAIDSL